MSDAWYGFAKTGTPATPDGVEWPCYDAQNHVHMCVDENGWLTALAYGLTLATTTQFCSILPLHIWSAG